MNNYDLTLTCASLKLYVFSYTVPFKPTCQKICLKLVLFIYMWEII